jgi:hypothetical protein
MKIQGFQNIPSVLQNIRKDVSSAEGASGANPSSSVTLQLSRNLAVLTTLEPQATAYRQARVDALTSQEQSGKLVPYLTPIAEKLQEIKSTT